MNNDLNKNAGQEPEVMDFFAAGKEARHVTGKDGTEMENRSSGSRHRGPAGRYQGLLGGKNGHKSKPKVHEDLEREFSKILQKDETPEPEPAPAPEPTRAIPAEPEPSFNFEAAAEPERTVEPAAEPEPEPVFEPIAEPEPEPVFEPAAEPEPKFTFEPAAEPELSTDSELWRALMGGDESESDDFSAMDMAAFLIANQQAESDPVADLTAALLENNRMEEDEEELALFERLDAQQEPEPAPAVEEQLEPMPAPPVRKPPVREPEDDFDDYDDEDDEDDDPPSRRRRGGLIAAVSAAVLCVALLVSAFAVSRRSTIFPHVSIQGENVSAMTVDEAASVVKKAGWDGPEAVVLKAELPAGVDLEVHAKDVGWNVTAEEAAQAAYDYGRDGNFLTNFITYIRTSIAGHELADDLTAETDASELKSLVKKAVDEANDAMSEGSMEIDTEKKVLRLVKGGDLLMVSTDEIYNRVLEALEDRKPEISCIKKVDESADVPEVDLEKLHDEVCGEPENASYDPEKKEVVEGKPGIEFDVKEAKRLWKDAKPGDLVEIPLEVKEPEFKKENVTELFADKLASKATSLSGSSGNRINNITLAAQKINGVIVDPGKSFSYNETVGQRTTARGFREAGAYVNGQVVNEVGGGICQVSSTLYYCTLYSNLKITARTNHYFPVAYIESGLDATVSWGAPDFRFENNRTFPVKIVAYVSGGSVTVEIWGTNVDGSTVKMDSTTSGMTTTTYRNVYDKDGNLLTRTQEAVSVYHSHEESRPTAAPRPVTTPAPAAPTPAPAVPTPTPAEPTPAPAVPTPAPVEPTPAPAEPTPDAPVPDVPDEGGE